LRPIDGELLDGMPVGTIVRGQIIMHEDEIVGRAAGRMVRPRAAAARPASTREAVAVV